MKNKPAENVRLIPGSGQRSRRSSIDSSYIKASFGRSVECHPRLPPRVVVTGNTMDATGFFVHCYAMISDPIVMLQDDAGATQQSHCSPLSHTQRVYRELRRLIIAGDILPGSKLKISEIRVQLDAGGTPVREALSLLTSDQLVERIDQRGFRAAPVSRPNFQELLELRCQLESIALRTSVTTGTSDWETSLEQALDALNAADRADRERWEALHKGFHRTLIGACGSPILLRFCDQLYDLNIRYRNLAARASRLGPRDVTREHRALLDAALGRDADFACQTLCQHYNRTGDYLAEQLTDLD